MTYTQCAFCIGFHLDSFKVVSLIYIAPFHCLEGADVFLSNSREWFVIGCSGGRGSLWHGQNWIWCVWLLIVAAYGMGRTEIWFVICYCGVGRIKIWFVIGYCGSSGSLWHGQDWNLVCDWLQWVQWQPKGWAGLKSVAKMRMENELVEGIGNILDHWVNFQFDRPINHVLGAT